MEGADLRTGGELLVATATDPEAFGTFFRRHVRGVLAFFRRRGATAEVALDLTAETFAFALEAPPRYELRPEPARNWLYGIAWNKLHEAQRRGRADDAVRRAGHGADGPDRRGDRWDRGAALKLEVPEGA